MSATKAESTPETPKRLDYVDALRVALMILRSRDCCQSPQMAREHAQWAGVRLGLGESDPRSRDVHRGAAWSSAGLAQRTLVCLCLGCIPVRGSPGRLARDLSGEGQDPHEDRTRSLCQRPLGLCLSLLDRDAASAVARGQRPPGFRPDFDHRFGWRRDELSL